MPKAKTKPKNRMKPERVQFWTRLVERGRSFAARICNVLGWLEVAAGALKRLFGCRGDDDKP